jgi:hypothetical protein
MNYRAQQSEFRKRSTPLLLSLGLAACLALASARAEQKYPMPKDTPFDPHPAASGSKTRQVLTYGVDADGTPVPRKTIRITNNTSGTVYPVMRDPNSNVLSSNPKVGLYDPYDAPNKEYRGYIGYTEGGNYYFGLKPGQSILVSVPLVFWNGARISIGTVGTYLVATKNPNPLRYDANSTRAIAPAETSADTIKNGVVMWYRAETAQAPNDDTADQLAEWTIRDHGYLSNHAISQRTKIPDNQLVTLINYDVSNVDNLYLPLAMEALDAWIVPQQSGSGPTPNRTGWKPGSHQDCFGWTGADNTNEFLQANLRKFTADNNTLLGEYFGGKGWPYYNFPNPSNLKTIPMKIPSGANVFAQSPIKGVPSSYGDGTWETDKYMLSSGGTAPIQTAIGWSGTVNNQPGSTVINLDSINTQAKFAFIQPGYAVEGLPPAGNKGIRNPIQPGTTVVKVHPDDYTVEISKPLVAPVEACAFQFTRPTNDYASEAMIRLWYSWAQYYLENWKDKNQQAPTAPVQIQGSLKAEMATLHFNEAHPELVEGMAVQGPGLDNAMTEKGIHQGDALILSISGDKKSVILSQVSNTTTSDASYTFSPPQKLLWTPTREGDPGYPLIENFNFSNVPEWNDPYYFSQKVYMVMASMNQIGKPDNNNVCKFMQDIIGANMGYIFDQAGKDSTEGQMVIAMIRDMIKSVLRGVTDFTKFPDIIENGKHVRWYPDPSVPTGGQKFNVFNLDPFVWFVHVQLGFSGYGFSVDDDTADVGAGGATQLQISVTKTGGLKNPNVWTIQAPYGPVKNVSCTYSGPDHGDTLYSALKDVSDTTPIKITAVGPHHLSNDAIVVIDQVNGDQAANGTFKIGNVTQDTFELFDQTTGAPIAPTGKYVATPTPGRWSYPLHPYIDTGSDLTKVFYKVTGDDALGTFQGTSVLVLNTPTKKDENVRVWQLGTQSTGRLLLNSKLLNADGTPLPAGTYQFTFYGAGQTP